MRRPHNGSRPPERTAPTGNGKGGPFYRWNGNPTPTPVPLACAGCPRPMATTTPVPDGWVRHKGRGLCDSCYHRARREGRADQHPTAPRDPAPNTADHARHLDAWLWERRARGVPPEGHAA